MPKGYWVPVLHSHLPFVKHPEHDYFLEEHWLFEAISECYIPLLMQMKRLEEEGVDYRLTLSVTPPLAEMLDDRVLREKYALHLEKQLALADQEIQRVINDPQYRDVAHFYYDRYHAIKDFYHGFLSSNVLNGYRYFAKQGKLEIITCAATHGFLPLLSVNPLAVDVQIKIAVATHQKHFGVPPNGIWLPECAYYEGLDKILSDNGIRFFFMDSHGLIFAKPTSRFGVFAPVYTPEGVAVFGRDPESSKKVWSSKEGYPGDPNYRDFYRDIGYDLPFETIAPYISPDGVRVFTGFKYHRVSSDANEKEVYDPLRALQKAKEHAENFHFEREQQIEHLGHHMDRKPMIVSPYDAELFGHWWFEGPDFLYHLFKTMDEHQVIRAITPMEYLSLYNKNQVVIPCVSSWGDRGYFDVWLNSGNDWVYRHLHGMAAQMQRLAKEHSEEKNHIKIRTLNQLLRELLLAQSSDWAFLMTTQTAMEYSIRRTKEHIFNFARLHEMVVNNEVDTGYLQWLEHKNSIFQGIDYRVFSK